MGEFSTCPKCGARFQTESPGTHACPGCLLLGALTENSASEDDPPFAGEGSAPVVENYEVFERIGQGGTAEVFRARQLRPIKREVALKLIRPAMGSDQVLARFEAERQVLARLQHPNIANVLDAGHTENGRPFFALEFVDGRPISDYAEAEGLGLRERLKLFEKVASAVHHAHQRGIVHRDLKPSNILVDAEGEPKVIDFGIARALEEDLEAQTLFLTREGDFLGTPAYMSPEQARGEVAEIDTRTDVYALGVVLYELLTGKLPTETTEIRAVAAGADTQIVRPSRRKVTTTTVNTKSLRGDIDWIVMRALESEKERRYDSVAALGDDIGRYLRDEPVSAGPPTAGYRLKKLARRHRGLAAGVMLAAVSMVVGTVVSVTQAVRATTAEAAAKSAAREAKAAGEKAEREREVAQAVNDFLVDDLLGAVDMERTAEPDVRVMDLVERAADKVDERFGGKPRVAASLHETIGGVYYGVARQEEAFDHYRRARDAYAQLPGEIDTRPHLRRTVRKMAAARFRQRKLPEARALLEEALEIWDGPEVPVESRQGAKMFLASLLRAEGDEPGALEILKELEAELKGTESEFARQVDYNLGLIFNWVGMPAEAIPYLQRFVDFLGDSASGDKGDALTELAKAKHYTGQSEAAEKDFLEASEILRRLRPPGHPSRILTDEALASMYDDTGRLELARPIYERLIADGVKEGETPHAHTLVALHNYAIAISGTDRDRAIELLEMAIAGRAERFGDSHPMTSQSRDSLALEFWFADRFDEAVALWTRVRDDYRKTLGPAHPQTLRTMRLLTNAGFLQNDPETGLARARNLLAQPPLGVEEFDRGGEEQRTKTYETLADQKIEVPHSWRDLALAILKVRPDDRQAWGVLGRAVEAGGENELAKLFAAARDGKGVAETLAAAPSEALEALLADAPEALAWLKKQE